MASSKYPPGRNERVGRAWKQLYTAQRKFGFPEFAKPTDIHSNWHVSYSVPHDVMDAIRRDSAVVYEVFGKLPWSQAPKPKEANANQGEH